MNPKQLTILRATYCTAIATALLLVLIFETRLLPVGTRAYDSQTNYLCKLGGIALTFVDLFVALKMMTFGQVKAVLQASPEKYFTFSQMRIFLLAAALLIDVAAYYYLGEDPTLAYLALIAAVGFCFVWPSMGKMQYELEKAAEQTEK